MYSILFSKTYNSQPCCTAHGFDSKFVQPSDLKLVLKEHYGRIYDDVKIEFTDASCNFLIVSCTNHGDFITFEVTWEWLKCYSL
jgi:hypothetical protein